MIGLPSVSLDDESKRLLEQIRPGSIILFRRNIKDRAQIRLLTEDIKTFLGYKPLIAIDQEGGMVTRLTTGFSLSPGAMALSISNDPDAPYEAGRIMGQEMKEVGIDWNLAPVVDINTNSQNPVIGIRSFSENVGTVIHNASEFIKGLGESSVISCLKHFPGSGRVAVDPHLDMPIISASKQELYNQELIPFIKIDSPSWMPTHVYVPSLQTEKVPATVSKEILTGMIRDELKYDGVLVADDLIMGGVSKLYSIESAALKTFTAGMDIVAICHDPDKQVEAYNLLKKEISVSEELQTRFIESTTRIDKLVRIANTDSAVMTSEKWIENSRKMDKISVSSVRMLKNKNNLLPVKKIDNILFGSFIRPVLIEDSNDEIPDIITKTSIKLNCRVVRLENIITDNVTEEYVTMLKGKKNLIFTENAHLSESLKLFIEKLAVISDSLLLIAIRNPYDTDIDGIEDAVCSYGYNKSQQQGILNLLFDHGGIKN